MIAAHIKRRSECSVEERLDAENIVMVACSLGCDALYEQGYVSVDEHGMIIATSSDDLTRDVEDHVRFLAGRTCAVHKDGSGRYFQWHRDNVLRG